MAESGYLPRDQSPNSKYQLDMMPADGFSRAWVLRNMASTRAARKKTGVLDFRLQPTVRLHQQLPVYEGLH